MSPGEIDHSRFLAIPRGGHVILGILSAALDLEPDQLRTDGDPSDLTVVVDDCALSGARFRTFLGQNRIGGRVIFAPLFAPRPLLDRVASEEERVAFCLSGADLRFEELSPNEAPSPRFTSGYWFGSPEPIAFPWNEPDRFLWDASNERALACWQIVPASHCIKNRSRGAVRPRPVQRTVPGHGNLGVSDATLCGDFEGNVALMNVESNRVAMLDPIGSDAWRAIASAGTPMGACRKLAQHYSVKPEDLAGDLHELIERLTEEGFLAAKNGPERRLGPQNRTASGA